MASGLKMIKQELGPDALILSTKTVRNGKLGLLSKPMLEITAAIDSDFPQNPPEEKPVRFTLASQQKQQAKIPQENRSFTRVINDPVEQYLDRGAPPQRENEQECFREYPTSQPKVAPAPVVPAAPAKKEEKSSDKNNGIQSEVEELKQLVNNLAGQISVLSNKESKSVNNTPSKTPAKKKNRTQSPISNRVTVDRFLSLLTAKGVNPAAARGIAGSMRSSLNTQELNNANFVTNVLINKLQSLIKVSPPDFSNQKKQRRIALVGATGVGKTTTLAKIAASYLQQYSNSIALITIDTYRIAAVEQLKVYGQIMHIPVDVVITPQQLGKALARHRNKKLILIDTAGRSPRDSFCIDELTSFFTPEYNIEKHLVLSATTRENEIIETIQQFSKIKIANTIFTKIDECMSLGVLLNTQLQNSNPISYITNGQRVPEDLLEITPKKIAELIMSQDQGSLHE